MDTVEKAVLVPAPHVIRAELLDVGRTSNATLAVFGKAACSAGDGDHEQNDPRTSATDTIANILHWLVEAYGEAVDLHEVLTVLDSATTHFIAEQTEVEP
jgi:hypothetical protein